MDRTLYIVAYDITDDKRLQRASHFLKGYSTGGQRSVYECYLTEGELKYIMSKLKWLILDIEDRVHIFQLDGRSRTHVMGIAVEPNDPSYFYIG